MAGMLRLAMAFSVLLSLSLPSSHAQTSACKNYKFTANKVFASCSDLPYLNSFLRWTFEQSTGKLQTGVTTSNWVSWAINLNLNSASAAMLGAQSLVDFQQSSGTIKTHGILNAVSSCVLMPLGAMVARYLKVFKSADPAWFYLHTTCQTIAYVVGVAGWATGLKLGIDSPGTQYDTHRNIGIVLFCRATLQVFALLLRPNKDHKFRFYWNIYHHTTRYAVIILSILNIFEGFDILKPHKNWKKAYIGLIIALGVQAALLEAYTWYVVLKRKRSEKALHTANGVNSYGA